MSHFYHLSSKEVVSIWWLGHANKQILDVKSQIVLHRMTEKQKSQRKCTVQSHVKAFILKPLVRNPKHTQVKDTGLPIACVTNYITELVNSQANVITGLHKQTNTPELTSTPPPFYGWILQGHSRWILYWSAEPLSFSLCAWFWL